jgi:hypothetical protein
VNTAANANSYIQKYDLQMLYVVSQAAIVGVAVDVVVVECNYTYKQ